jgi:hypothetical protein
MPLIPDIWQQNRVHDLWSSSPRPVKWLLSEVANVVCSRLDSITSHPTTLARLRAADIVGLCDKVDIGLLLNESDLPSDLQELVSEYPREHWKDLLSIAGLVREDIERDLRANPRLDYLRRKPETRTVFKEGSG